ncbi:MAG: hypothetical protein LQ351_006277 [Letrouitia transgressa]|nr:MAG: hypothetical protein LQ351_006277 [Letrouitia transgressa]
MIQTKAAQTFNHTFNTDGDISVLSPPSPPTSGSRSLICDDGRPLEIDPNSNLPPLILESLYSSPDNTFQGPIELETSESRSQSSRLSPCGKVRVTNAMTPTASIRPPTPFDLNILELNLLHHYSTVTYVSLANDIPSVRDVWQVSVPKEAVSYKFLMHVILALAAVQMMTLRSDQRLIYSRAATMHRDWALKSAVSWFQNVTSTNCHALFAFSSLITLLVFTFPPPKQGEIAPQPIDCIQDVFTLVRGAGTIVSIAHQWIIQGHLRELLTYDLGEHESQLTLSESLAFESLEALNEQEIQSTQERFIYQSAIQDLKATFRLYQAISRERSTLAFRWPFVVHQSYLDFLKGREPMALVILGHFAVLLHSISAQWWSRGRGRALLENICHILSAKWQCALRWPKAVIFGNDQVC